MALILKDRLKETTTTSGTGTYTLGGAETGFEAFSQIGDGNTTYYCCTDGSDFEIGIGTYTLSGTTLARTTILQSSNSDAAVDWTAGATRIIFCTQPGDKAVYLDASNQLTINGSAVTSSVTELNILDGVTSTTAELNILDGVTASATDINLIDGITNGTVIASKAIVTDANIDITGGRNITITGNMTIGGDIDLEGDIDVNGTLEADAITLAGVTLAETIADTVGAMVSSNTETGLAVTYDDADNTLDFVIGSQVIVNSMLADDAVGADELAANAVVTASIVDANVTTVKITDGNVTTAKIAADAITGAKIADDAIDSEHYTDGSIDTAHISADAITGAKIADDAIDSEHYTDGSIDTAHIANLQITTGLIAADAITAAKIADDAIDSEHYTDGSIDTAHIADANVTLAKIANQAANTVLVRDANSSGVVSAKAVATTQILIGDGTGFTAAALSGDVTMTNAGAVTIAANAVEGSMLNTDVISGQTALASGLATTDELLVSDAGTLKRMDVSVLITAIGAASVDDATALAIALG